MAQQLKKRATSTDDDTTTEVPVEIKKSKDSDVDTAEIDELLDEIDEVLEFNDAEMAEMLDAERRRAYREKLKSISFIGKRAEDPCKDVVRVPEHMAEALLRTGMFKESNCQGC